jgi:hypothetical protein
MKYPFSVVIIFLVGFSLLMPKMGSSQEFKGGLVGGATTSQIGGDALSGFNKWGFYAGPTVSYPLKDDLDLNAQILFIKKGSHATKEEINKGQYLWEKLTLSYFEVPLMVEYEVKSDLFLQGGISVDYLLQVKTLARGTIENHNFREVSLNGLAGVRYQFSKRFSITGQINHSLIPINNGPITIRTGSASVSDLQNRPANILIKFGLRYSLGAL